MSGTVGGGGFATPYQNPQFAPQGLFGSLLGSIAAPAGSVLGNIFGHQQLGSQIGSTVGQFAHLLPFAAGPQMAAPQAGQQQLDPQSLASLVAMIRQAAQSAQQGLQILDTVHKAAPGLLPFALAPDQQQQQAGGQDMAPQGLFGSILGKIAAPAGGVIGGLFGNKQLGTRIGGTAGTIASFLPFSAGPQQAGQVADGQQQLDPQSLGTLVNIIRQAVQAAQQGLQILDAVQKAAPGLLPLALGPDQQQQQPAAGQDMAPQGLFGSILGKVAGTAGGALGGLFGQQQLGSKIGSTVGQFAHLLPFAAGPQMAGQGTDGQQQMDPQSLANLVAMIRQAAQAAQQGLQILDTVHKAAPGLLPFALAPDQQQQQQVGGQEMAPQGLFGSILGKVAGSAGGALGGLFGHQQLGSQIGSTVGQFAHLLPFAAGPQMGNSMGTLH